MRTKTLKDFRTSDKSCYGALLIRNSKQYTGTLPGTDSQRWYMLRLIRFLFLFLILLIGLAFTVKNEQLVELNYFVGTIELSVSLLLILGMFVGSILGVMSSMIAILPLKREVSRLRQQTSIKEQEIMNLRAIPIKDGPWTSRPTFLAAVATGVFFRLVGSDKKDTVSTPPARKKYFFIGILQGT
jgi:lipopolysaccharide assembly protein A